MSKSSKKRKPCSSWIEPEPPKKLGAGSESVVYEICCADTKNCNFARKRAHGNVVNEVKMLKECAKVELCPPIEAILPISNQVIDIITKKLDLTLFQYIMKEQDIKACRTMIAKAYKMLVDLHQAGIAHNDASVENFMILYSPDKKQKKLYLIDMHVASKLTIHKAKKDFEQLTESLFQTFALVYMDYSGKALDLANFVKNTLGF